MSHGSLQAAVMGVSLVSVRRTPACEREEKGADTKLGETSMKSLSENNSSCELLET